MTGPDQLPASVLAHVLQFVPLRLRLHTCALVSQQWATAAALATVNPNTESLSDSSAASLQHWLGHHGRHIQSLRAVAVPAQSSNPAQRPFLHLPCYKLQQLTSLDLSGVTLELRPARSVADPMAAALKKLPRLSQLLLQQCKITCQEAALWMLRWPLSGLTRLALQVGATLIKQSSTVWVLGHRVPASPLVSAAVVHKYS